VSHNFLGGFGSIVSSWEYSIVRDGEKGEGGVDPAASASRSPGIISFGADDGGGAMVGIEREREGVPW